ncbi:MAG: iron-containing alcohol dehydrogenase, partial [Agromyces sp.]
MGAFSQVTDPTDLSQVRSAIDRAGGSERLVPLGIHRLEISADAADHAAQRLSELLESAGGPVAGANVVLLTDPTPMRKGDDDAKARVEALLRAQFQVTHVVLHDHDGHVFADDASLDEATEALRGADGVVSVGSGTISDIAKVASDRVGGIPFVLVQTAASVDGYTDNVSVILRSGAKRTIPSRWPDVVLADTEIIQDAPVELNTSGFGELLSLFTAPADWWLASQIGTDHSFHETPRDLLLTFAGNPSEWGAGIGDGNRAAIEQLTKVLAIRGIGTGIAGSTACLSGMEHLVSHMLDMNAAANHHEIGLHGAQVGVASVVGAITWEYLLEQIRAGRPVAAPRVRTEAEVLAVFADLDPSGNLGAECWRDYSAKLTAWANAAPDLHQLIADADALEAQLGAMLPDSARLATGLVRAGAVATPSALDGWVSADVW